MALQGHRVAGPKPSMPAPARQQLRRMQRTQFSLAVERTLGHPQPIGTTSLQPHQFAGATNSMPTLSKNKLRRMHRFCSPQEALQNSFDFAQPFQFPQKAEKTSVRRYASSDAVIARIPPEKTFAHRSIEITKLAAIHRLTIAWADTNKLIAIVPEPKAFADATSQVDVCESIVATVPVTIDDRNKVDADPGILPVTIDYIERLTRRQVRKRVIIPLGLPDTKRSVVSPEKEQEKGLERFLIRG